MSADHIFDLVESIENGKYQKLCPSRIWHLWQACHSQAEKGCTKLDVVKVLGDYGFKLEDSLTHEDHSACSFDFCEFSSRNCTAIKQYHEPSRHEEGDQIQVAERHESGKLAFLFKSYLMTTSFVVLSKQKADGVES